MQVDQNLLLQQILDAVKVNNSEILELKQEVIELKQDVSILKQEVAELKQDVSSLNCRVDQLESTVDSMREEMSQGFEKVEKMQGILAHDLLSAKAEIDMLQRQVSEEAV
ncbi:hypothetical protein SAMN05444392_101589 [Seinonella peptonophila]|uniref:Uncharacterized protein n=1 Tax=Seinonella peptonophila TaxID=112248 RepID=A0A1M4TQT1_9BACL|nr:hypothetical protein [Seinonella peptonophila]SHE46744.1 hypothetical protein SAMN05444392_101589 [Seinonella peptonophila]